MFDHDVILQIQDAILAIKQKRIGVKVRLQHRQQIAGVIYHCAASPPLLKLTNVILEFS